MNTQHLDIPYHAIFSIEFFPVLSEDKHESFIEKILAYQELGITNINITCKSNQGFLTRHMVQLIRSHTDINVIPHIAAYKLTKKELDETLQEYHDLQIKHLFVVRGDLDHRMAQPDASVDFPYAIDLVKQITQWDNSFCIGVAGYPERHYQEPNVILETRYLYDKVNAGASYIITQLFFDNRDYYDFIDRCQLFDITVPIIPGITYIKDKLHAEKIASIALGSKIPSALLQQLYNHNNEFGVQWMHNQIKDLLHSSKTKNIHLYTFNVLHPFQDILQTYNEMFTNKTNLNQ